MVTHRHGRKEKPEISRSHKDKQSNSKIGHRRWSYELIGMAGISSQVAVYLRYQPMSVLSGAGQPDFKSLSTGLIFFY